MKYATIIIILILFGAIFAYAVWINKYKSLPTPSEAQPVPDITAIPAETASPPSGQDNIEAGKLVEPVKDFKSRITKKPFGIYISPQTSPVQPEKFTGYHTGADAEYSDILEDTPVYAISKGTVEYRGLVNGYGGVLVIKHEIDGQKILVLYGHLRKSSMAAKDTTLNTNDQIAVLGKDKSAETDGERKHLHLGMIKDDKIDFRGYVQSEIELSEWYNPIDFHQ